MEVKYEVTIIIVLVERTIKMLFFNLSQMSNYFYLINTYIAIKFDIIKFIFAKTFMNCSKKK